MRSALLVFALLQSLLPKAGVQQVTVATSTSAPSVARGAVVTLFADVTPNANIHVYATDKQGFTPISLVMSSRPNTTIGKVTYPMPQSGITPGIDMLVPVPMYVRPFRLSVPVTISGAAKLGDVIEVPGVLKYEACNDKLCFPATSLPVSWKIAVK